LKDKGFGALKGKGELHVFTDSPPISTYLYGMDAGPFVYVKND
jgi:aminopeptidase N